MGCDKLACVIVFVALCAPAPAPAPASAQIAAQLAPERPLSEVVTVRPGATCLDVAELAPRIGRWRQRETVDARIRVEVRGDDTRARSVAFTVTKEGGPSAERRLTDVPEDCDQLHAAVALSIALAIDATLVAGTTPPPEIPDAEPERSLLAPPPPARERGAPHLDASASLGPALGLVTDTTLALAAVPRLALWPWSFASFAFTGLAVRSDGQTLRGAPSSDFDLLIIAPGLEACASLSPLDKLSAELCAASQLGAFTTISHSGTGTVSSLFWSVGGLGRMSVWLSGRLAVAVTAHVTYTPIPHAVRVLGEAGAPNLVRPLPDVGLLVLVGPVFRIF